MIPVIPVLCACGFIASFLGLTWYDSLSQSRKDEADRLAGEIAMDLFNKTVGNLDASQMRRVAALVQSRLDA